MIIVRKSPFTGTVHRMELDVSPENLARLDRGEPIQRVFPHLSADEREFLISGITPVEWESFLGGGDE